VLAFTISLSDLDLDFVDSLTVKKTINPPTGSLQSLQAASNSNLDLNQDSFVNLSFQSAGSLIEAVRNLATNYSGTVAKGISKYSEDQNNLPRVAALIELLGHDEAFTLFREAPQKTWNNVGAYMSANPFDKSTQIDLDEVASVFRILRAYTIEHRGIDDDQKVATNLDRIPSKDITRAIAGESAQTVAKILSGLSQNKVFDITPLLDSKLSMDVLSAMATIKSLDVKELRALESQVLRRVSGTDGNNVLPAQNESRIFASLKNLQPHEEEASFATLLLADSDIEFRARRFRLYSVHLKSLRLDVLRDESHRAIQQFEVVV
jgi:hypothetical protein